MEPDRPTSSKGICSIKVVIRSLVMVDISFNEFMRLFQEFIGKAV
jgi:hypothetical protein